MFDLTHLHPMIVHFPIALLIIGFLSDFVGLIVKKNFFSTAGFYLLILGAAGVLAAYLSGNLAGDGVTEVGTLGQALETHESAATLTLWLIAAAAIVRIGLVLMKKYSGLLKGVAFALLLLGVASIARTGYYGGELVFKHAAGVQFSLGSEFGSFQNENTDSTIPMTDTESHEEKD